MPANRLARGEEQLERITTTADWVMQFRPLNELWQCRGRMWKGRDVAAKILRHVSRHVLIGQRHFSLGALL